MGQVRGGRLFAVMVLAGAFATSLVAAGDALAETGSTELGATPPPPEPAPEAQPSPEAQPAPEAGEGALQSHVGALGSPDVQTRVTAVRALGDLRDPAAVAPLTQALRSDPNPEVRGWILRALGQINTPEARAAVIGSASSDADPRVRSLAAQIVPTAATPAPAPAAAAYPAPMYEPMPQPVAARTRDPNRGLRVAGWVMFGGSYGMAFMLGAIFIIFD
jgi:hypothetical protein